jgi:hypothetical protein
MYSEYLSEGGLFNYYFSFIASWGTLTKYKLMVP